MGKLSDRFADPEPDELDAILAADDASSTPTAPRLPVPGDRFHCLVTGTMIGSGSKSFGASSHVLTRGQVVTVTADLLEGARDRFGNLTGWPTWLHDEAEQVRRFGRALLAPGPAPEGLQRWTYGDAEWQDARARARAAAWAETDPDERSAKLAELERVYGPAALTSQTTAIYKRGEHPTERAAEAQEERFARARARGER
ncbi:hypothetical protein [Microbacterium sp. T2.11-28]|uniref:hypothetical protein n=1 Tax=Microbacterium sp. T2.11-28 TaxID=3041169 RepID=UPI0024777099|nr:hypothetical protein [Microbacterium sp. T2.11-28]CAI9386534.1 hypothetical protein MICABA_00447 [Microbacterium sp. T2.11-28]